ncbi:mechanosensitive ion channel family protein [bacterium]|nr:mechanosensitive ion channel family protein [bacterium]
MLQDVFADYGTQLVATILVILIAVIARSLLIRRVMKAYTDSPELRRRYIVLVRNVSLLVLLLALVLIWANELRTLAASIVVIAAALVIATKELILCLSGTFLRASSRVFKVGDRIEINGMRGDVIDHTLLTTTIFEIGPGHNIHQFTGRSITIPNSLFLSAPVLNETFMQEYVLHVLIVPLALDDDWQAAEEALLHAAQSECAIYLESARGHMKQLEEKHGLDAPSVDPRVSLHFPEAGKVNLLLRMPLPVRKRGRIEQAVYRRFANKYTKKIRPKANAKDTED